jgi:hypothetical protein
MLSSLMLTFHSFPLSTKAFYMSDGVPFTVRVHLTYDLQSTALASGLGSLSSSAPPTCAR